MMDSPALDLKPPREEVGRASSEVYVPVGADCGCLSFRASTPASHDKKLAYEPNHDYPRYRDRIRDPCATSEEVYDCPESTHG